MGADNKFKDRTGEISYTKNGTPAKIIKYINCKKILVEFQDDFKYQYFTSYINFKNKRLTNPYERRSKNSAGYIGVGKFNSKEHKEAYHKWASILQRCENTDYATNIDKSIASYKNCSVCDEWLNFQNFAEWYYDNYYNCENEPLCIDKDILFHGNNIYSPQTCILIPRRLNLLFIKELKRRGNLLIGAQRKSRGDGFISTLSTSNGVKYIGTFNDEMSAFQAYKREKELYIKKVANEYKSKIPRHVYLAIINYKIEITD